jgi:ubiquinone/menaquinone biosynthesis C-methylase UbiE
VGNGSHAELISAYAGSYTGIDLTDYAVHSTTTRLEHAHKRDSHSRASTKVVRMDAESMDFAAEVFDLVWSWGVIHHSANTRKILEEIHRVLRPGGTAITMVYHRSFWNYYIFAGLLAGLGRGTMLQKPSFHYARQKMIDGALARYYSIAEWRALVSDLFTVDDVRIYGSKAELIPLPTGKLKTAVKAMVPDRASRFFTNSCRMGMFLVSVLRKQE